MADDGWWSDVTHRDDELTLGAPSSTPRVDLSAHDAPTVQAAAVVDDAPTVQAPVVLPEAPVAQAPVGGQGAPYAGADVHVAPAWSLFEPVQPEQTPPPPPDDDEVPFWLLPAPPRPGMPPAPQLQPAPAAPDQRFGGPVHAVHGQLPQAPVAPTHRPLPAQQPGSGPLPSRRDRVRGAAKLSPADRAQEVLARATAAAGPLVERARTAPPVILVAAAAFGVGLVVVLGSLLSFGGDEDRATGRNTGTTARPSSGSAATPVDRTTITAEASSEQSPEGGTTYGAANTLDGKLTTAWNSNGNTDGPGPGMTLTYTFDAPVDLRAVTAANGYQKIGKAKGKNVDLWAANSRVRQVKVVTDGGEWMWTLKDSRAPQTLRKPFGTTKTVTLEILSVYKGSSFSDIAISEVSFGAVD